MKHIVKLLLGLAILAVALLAVGCESDAYIASQNLSKAADSFEIFRRAVFYDAINGEYMLVIEGFLSIEDQGNQLEVTVKTDEGEFLKHFLGLSDNVTYFVEQLDAASVSDAKYRVIFKPSSIVPNIDTQ